jgi:hypothetical protein
MSRTGCKERSRAGPSKGQLATLLRDLVRPRRTTQGGRSSTFKIQEGVVGLKQDLPCPSEERAGVSHPQGEVYVHHCQDTCRHGRAGWGVGDLDLSFHCREKYIIEAL